MDRSRFPKLYIKSKLWSVTIFARRFVKSDDSKEPPVLDSREMIPMIAASSNGTNDDEA